MVMSTNPAPILRMSSVQTSENAESLWQKNTVNVTENIPVGVQMKADWGNECEPVETQQWDVVPIP